MLDYYLIDRSGILVEEFVLGEDDAAVAIDGAGWTGGRWWSSAAFSVDMRGDPQLRSRVVPADRDGARAAYRRLGGGELPGEATLRGYFADPAPLAASAALRLDATPVPDGYRERRVYRVLFAGDLDSDGLAALRYRWRMAPSGDPRVPGGAQAEPGSGGAEHPQRILGAGRMSAAGDEFTWQLRRIGYGVAWCVDLTACLSGEPVGVRPLLRELTSAVRGQGLIPVTIERFA
jgi:hypothetical protein